MSTTVYIPVYKVVASYVVRQGRSWSPFEHLLLWHLARTKSTSGELAKLAGVPVRLVIEGLIELMGAGLVDVQSDTSSVAFEATERGRTAAALETLPEDIRTVRRRTTLCMDRLTGSFFEPEDLVLVHEDNLPQDAVLLRSRVQKLDMTPANSLDRLYMLEDETFQEWIDRRVTSRRLCAAVTMVAGMVTTGLPAYAPPALLDAVFEEMAAMGDTSQQDAFEAIVPEEPAEIFHAAVVRPDDLIVGGPEHLDVIERVLRECRSFVLLHTCFVHPDAVSRLLPAIETAANAGKTIDLLWGQRNNELQEWSRSAFLKVQEMFANVPAALRSRIRFADRETGSHAKILLADSAGGGRFEAYVGSCNWLSSRYKALEVSIRIQDPKPLAAIVSLLASLRMPTGRWTPDVHRLVDLRSALLRLPSGQGPNGAVAIVVDREHLRAIRHARDQATRRISAGCDLYGPAGETSVFVPMRTASAGSVKIELFYNNLARSLEEADAEEAIVRLGAKGIAVVPSETLHGKFLLWDSDCILVSSFNWLATTPSPWKPMGAEVGILVKASGIANVLAQKLAKCRAEFVRLVATPLLREPV